MGAPSLDFPEINIEKHGIALETNVSSLFEGLNDQVATSIWFDFEKYLLAQETIAFLLGIASNQIPLIANGSALPGGFVYVVRKFVKPGPRNR
jgi:hypothetical protein